MKPDLQTLNAETDEKLNVRLAELWGWKRLSPEDGWSESTCKTHMAKPNEDAIASPPRFCTDRNETAKVEDELTEGQHYRFDHHLCKIVNSVQKAFSAKPRQRTIALILTLQ